MKTTLVIDDDVMARLKAEAARRRCTMSELVETALRRLLDGEEPVKPLPPLPRFRGSKMLVDVADREALYEAMGDD